MKMIIDGIIETSKSVDLINITGGEPTLHPNLLEILSICKCPEIGRITMNSNGIRLAQDYPLCEQLAEMGVYVILSFHTFDRNISRQLHGQDILDLKLRAIDNLTRAGVRITLLNVMIHNLTESTTSGLLDLMQHNENILSLTVQTMTYTGQGGGHFGRTQHIPVDLAAHHVCEQSQGMIQFNDFITRPVAHPLCYLVCYLLKRGTDLLPFTRFTSRNIIEQMIRDSYLLHSDKGEEILKDMINQLYAEGQNESLLILRELVEKMYPSGESLTEFQRQKIAESAVRTIYIHTHMDEDTFDCSRAMLCPDLVPSEPGRLIPACTYNLFYRMKDEAFYAK
jgi:uncharacterized radical SAM superfamily Fe-S cluster-containing enzyme